MIKDLLNTYEKQKALEFYNKTLSTGCSVQYFRNSVSTINRIVRKIMPESNSNFSLLIELDILMDDILEMDSISDDEKNEAMLRLLDIDKEELQSLAKALIDQIKKDEQEAIDNGYCIDLIKDYTSKDE